MKVSVSKSTPERKLVAVIGASGEGVFLPENNRESSVYFGPNGLTYTPTNPLKDLLTEGFQGRVPVYEGDTITITF